MGNYTDNLENSNTKVCSSEKIWPLIGRRGYCHDLNCDIHGQYERDRRYHRHKIKDDEDALEWGWLSWILHISPYARVDYMHELKTAVMRVFGRLRYPRRPRFVLHWLPGDYHFHVGVASPKLSKSYAAPQGGSVAPQTARGRGRKHQDWCGLLPILMANVKLPWVTRVEFCLKEYEDDPNGWLKYCLRACEMQKYANPGEKIYGPTAASFKRREVISVAPGKKRDSRSLKTPLSWTPEQSELWDTPGIVC